MSTPPTPSPGPGRPPLREETASQQIQLRCTGGRKGHYNRAARMAGQTLAAWIFRHLDRASHYPPTPAPTPPTDTIQPP